MVETSKGVTSEAALKLKPMSREAIPAALEKAMRYRLLNEPAEAESICYDILSIEPENQQALVTLLLALTDRFGKGYSLGIHQAEDILPRLKDGYDRAYYAGVICERQAKAHILRGSPRAWNWAYGMLLKAMERYEEAEKLRSGLGNDDAILRWNACARILNQNIHLRPTEEERSEQPLE